jgi:pyruvate dehydrogenase E1 component alpha subunit
LTGIEQVLTHEDPIITSYRDHCHPLTRGGDVVEVIAELMGRVAGNCGGKGGSMHM